MAEAPSLSPSFTSAWRTRRIGFDGGVSDSLVAAIPRERQRHRSRLPQPVGFRGSFAQFAEFLPFANWCQFHRAAAFNGPGANGPVIRAKRATAPFERLRSR